MPASKPSFPALPGDTARKAKSIFNFGNLYLVIGDQLDQLLAESEISLIDPSSEKSASLVTLFTLITIFQFAEGLPDRKAADATRTRMDWKYALHLPLNYPGLKPITLCRYRQRLRANLQGQVVFEDLLNRIAAVGLLSRREKLGREAMVVIRSVCTTTRLDIMAQAINLALEALAAQRPEWLRAIALPHWYKRYDGLTLTNQIPHSEIEQSALARALGSDAQHLLQAVLGLDMQAAADVLEIHNLQKVYQDQFYLTHHNDGSKSQIQWRPDKCATCSLVENQSSQPTMARR